MPKKTTTAKVPSQVLSRARTLVTSRPVAAVEPAKKPRALKSLTTREKVIGALKKLHPMD